MNIRLPACMTALILGACAETQGAGQQQGSVADGMLLGVDSIEVFGDISLASDVGIHQDMAYVAVRNEGRAGTLFKVGLVLFDASDTILDEQDTHCGSVEGGATISNGNVAHCLYNLVDEGLPTPARAEVGFISLDNPLYPGGLWEVRGDVEVSGAGSSMGSAEAQVCRRQGVSDVHDDLYLEAYVLDTSGVPHDFGMEDHTLGAEECKTMAVGGLELPDDPEVLLIP